MNPEQEDFYGVKHPFGCPSRITVRPAFLKPHHVYVRCTDCHALALVPDPNYVVDTNANYVVDTNGEEVATS